LGTLKAAFNYLVDPSARDGRFVKELKKYCQINNIEFDLLFKQVVQLDIEPKGEEILAQDFLIWDLPTNFSELSCSQEQLKNKMFFLSNPPFGQNNNILLKFFKKICSDTNYANGSIIAFIVPKSFLKVNLQRKIAPNWHLIGTFHMPN
jgi:hypothetical protein